MTNWRYALLFPSFSLHHIPFPKSSFTTRYADSSLFENSASTVHLNHGLASPLLDNGYEGTGKVLCLLLSTKKTKQKSSLCRSWRFLIYHFLEPVCIHILSFFLFFRFFVIPGHGRAAKRLPIGQKKSFIRYPSIAGSVDVWNECG